MVWCYLVPVLMLLCIRAEWALGQTQFKSYASSTERFISPDKWVPSWRGLLSRLSGRKWMRWAAKWLYAQLLPGSRPPAHPSAALLTHPHTACTNYSSPHLALLQTCFLALFGFMDCILCTGNLQSYILAGLECSCEIEPCIHLCFDMVLFLVGNTCLVFAFFCSLCTCLQLCKPHVSNYSVTLEQPMCGRFSCCSFLMQSHFERISIMSTECSWRSVWRDHKQGKVLSARGHH